MLLKIVTFNIHHGEGIDRIVDLERIARVIEESDADIVALNEVDNRYSKRSNDIDQLEWLSKRLKTNHAVFGPAIVSGTHRDFDTTVRQFGNALLTRFPIVCKHNHIFKAPAAIENRALLEAQLDMDGHPLKCYVTHLSLSPLLQRKQARFIRNKIMNDGGPVLVMGDFNVKPGSKVWSILTQQLTDVSWNAAPSLTYPSFRPKMQLDYIFVSRHFQIVSSGVISDRYEASDHLPLQAAVVLSDPSLLPD
ncbi:MULTISPECIES: endonuclease/exonuclease/phosphatase family protein [unclassified Paenibacillus]|uniref:endonuclease/exonuclease/phosphatase family protein n=1 Tax=unclassified Paenibacillus TaxID=185978 RepID=UPI001C10DCE2|nr:MULTISPECIES: endonuclease/exonuclease/phosphatase family protein [unclassified Paenibacillus]MBU5443233.1 endonuclease/exonuclease/phosphatase family protein [Paenibacillus sp. MSJ-34]CAH0121957.1 hypothetical protein PAE9249_04493 [Paenibacillus sp. CECT 9249]